MSSYLEVPLLTLQRDQVPSGRLHPSAVYQPVLASYGPVLAKQSHVSVLVVILLAVKQQLDPPLELAP